jgi:hypothetical protein
MKKLTIWSLVGTTAGLIALDIYLAANSQEGDTISEVLLNASHKRPIIAFAAGALIGHLFWPQGETSNA